LTLKTLTKLVKTIKISKPMLEDYFKLEKLFLKI
jgi:hypothetical protein